MAFNSEIKGYMTFGKSFSRGGAFPLEAYEIWTDYDALVAYAANTDPSKDPSYIGQKVAYVDLENNKVTHYGIEIDGTLKELGASPIGDEKSIVIGEDNTISLKGVDGLTFERDILDEEGQPTGQKENIQYQPLMTKDGLIWVEPSKTTVEGLASLIDGLTARVSALENDRVTEAELAAAVKAEEDRALAAEEALGKRIDAIDFIDAEELATAISGVEAKIPTNNNQLKNGAGYQTASDVSSAITTAIANKADIGTTLAEYGITDAYTKTEADSAIEDAIKDFATTEYVDTEIEAIEEAISKLNHFTTKIVTSLDEVTETGVLYLIKDESVAGVDKYNEYILVDGAAVLIGDTTTDLSNYYNKEAIDGKVETINGAIADEVEAREALAEEVAALKAVDNATQEELDAYKTEVTSDIATAKSEAIADADGKLANKVNTSDFEAFKTINTQAIADARANAVADVEAKGYAVASEVTTELAKKIETGTITHTSGGVTEGVIVDGTTMNIVVDAYKKSETYTRSEVDTAITNKIGEMTGGESAADVLAALNDYKKANDAEIYGSDKVAAWTDAEGKYTPVYTQDSRIDSLTTAVATAQSQADKGVEDAAAAKAVADQNKIDLGTLQTNFDNIVTKAETGLVSKVSALEAKDTELVSSINGLDTTVKSHTTTITEHGTKLTALDNKDTELAALIQANTDKFADYYTTTQVDTKVKEVADAVGAIDLTPYAKTSDVDTALALKANAADVYTKTQADAAFMNEEEVDARINALIVAADPEGGKTITNIQNLVKYVDENAGQIAALVTTVDSHTAKFVGLDSDDTVVSYVAEQIDSAIAGLVMPKGSEEVTYAADGTLGLGKVSTDKLVMGTDTLVIDGGSAAK